MSKFTEESVDLDGGGYFIPVILTRPKNPLRKYPAIILLHGKASNKNEVGNGYIMMADMSAINDFVTIRFDFIGNNDSGFDYIEYTILRAVKKTEIVLNYCSGLSFVDIKTLVFLDGVKAEQLLYLRLRTDPTFHRSSPGHVQ